ncbi:Hypothetical predicted protein [Podarcis lilfordi]|uniref:Uncharacterized protein n=1 Tax=Podarcis lilfordi TaxID=74358 RepID=A0AA35L0Z5_9SAUR|nr:Hypothetical predicted protein [Podarcis lilfordi]
MGGLKLLRLNSICCSVPAAASRRPCKSSSLILLEVVLTQSRCHKKFVNIKLLLRARGGAARLPFAPPPPPFAAPRQQRAAAATVRRGCTPPTHPPKTRGARAHAM